MSGAYSFRFIVGQAVSSGPPLTYTVPAGLLAIVQHIDVSPDTGIGGDGIIVQVATISTVANPIWITCPFQQDSVSWSGKLVLNAGDTLNVSALVTACDVQVSGAQLTAP